MIQVAVKILATVLSKCLIIHPILRGEKKDIEKKREKLGEKSVAGKDGWGWGQMDSEQGNL